MKLTNIDFKEIIKMSKGDVIYTLMNDTQRLEYIFERPFYTIFSDIFDFIFVVGFLLYIEPVVLLILLITTPFIYIFSIKTARIQKQTSDNTQKADSKITVSIEQLLSGYETIKSFNAEAKEQERFNKLSDESYKNRKAGTKSLSIFMPIEATLSTIGIALVLLYAVYQVSNHALAVGMIVVIADYSRKFYQPIRNISNYLQVIQKALVSIGKIIEFLTIKEEAQTGSLKNIKMSL
ncbi:ABC transporter ATP-binding protein [Campylobacter sp. RM16189]|uniref:ABC transporter ATP-binding protein n=1 Tax=Campylobacter sp. RM16189 TaxID=1705726 RepID=UPI0032D5851B